MKVAKYRWQFLARLVGMLALGLSGCLALWLSPPRAGIHSREAGGLDAQRKPTWKETLATIPEASRFNSCRVRAAC